MRLGLRMTVSSVCTRLFVSGSLQSLRILTSATEHRIYYCIFSVWYFLSLICSDFLFISRFSWENWSRTPPMPLTRSDSSRWLTRGLSQPLRNSTSKYRWVIYIMIYSRLSISRTQIFEFCYQFWIKNTFWLLSPTII